MPFWEKIHLKIKVFSLPCISQDLQYLTAHENPLDEFEDIQQLIFFPKFHENPTIFGGVDSILGVGSQINQKIKRTPPNMNVRFS